ncbi:hypothetical protein [Streptococcus sp. Marseille-P7376]|uniref:hypothetical protein n=1 Tax=Streptococcus sp. Marseille-P7376 TaxID=2592044 RepID=UPI001652B902|nr:hypothetical protein [Streptococcus sp. Marseille-P7376]
MPRDFKDTMFFTLFMCSLMVLGMSVWNLYLLEHFFLGNLAAAFLPGFITDFLLDVLLSRTFGQRTSISLFERLSQALAKDCGHIWGYGASNGIIDVYLWSAF